MEISLCEELFTEQLWRASEDQALGAHRHMMVHRAHCPAWEKRKRSGHVGLPREGVAEFEGKADGEGQRHCRPWGREEDSLWGHSPQPKSPQSVIPMRLSSFSPPPATSHRPSSHPEPLGPPAKLLLHDCLQALPSPCNAQSFQLPPQSKSFNAQLHSSRSIPSSVLHLHLLHGALVTHSFIHSLIQQALMGHLSVPAIVPAARDRKTDQTQSFLSRSSWARSYHAHSITICEPSLLSLTRHLTLWPEIALCVFPPCSVRDTCLTNTSI